MNSVIHLQAYRAVSSSMLVLVDLQEDAASFETERALANCRLALAHARANDVPVAFTRRVVGSPFASGTSSSQWIEGFQPWGVDMIFERERPSCYASPNFDEVVTRAGGHFVFAGLAGETSCLSTVVEASHRGHRATFLEDASACYGFGGISSADVQRVVAKIIALYGEQTSTARWIRATMSSAARSEERERGR